MATSNHARISTILTDVIEQVSWESQQGKDIWELSPHSKLMKHIRRRLNECCLSQDSKDALGRLLSEIGCGRSDGLYGQRNQAVHSFLWLNPDGSPLAARVGHSVTRSQKVGEKELSELANKIARVSEQMLDLTYPTSDITIEYSQSTADVSAASWMKP